MNDNEVAALLFPGEEGFAKWQSNPEYSKYLGELAEGTVDQLRLEPERWAQERTRLLAETQSLAFQNYKGFIQTADCSRQVSHEFGALSEHITSLLDGLPELSNQCEGFMAGANEIAAKRRQYLLALQYHTQLLEILEIPQLMDTCVRNGYYEEALDLETYVQRIARRHIDIRVIKDIVREVAVTTRLMLSQLLQLLRVPINLPGCLKVIVHLRRLGVFGESELRIQFLHSRDAWLQSSLRALDSTDAYTYISRAIDIVRVTLGDIASQYRAIFPEEGEGQTPGILYGWVNQVVEAFLALLSVHLPRVTEGTLINSLLGQCMFLGMSLGRVGLDVRPLMVPIFETVVYNTFTGTVTSTIEDFVRQVDKDPYGTSTPCKVAGETPERGQGGVGPSNMLVPPHTALEYTALALLVNAFCEAYNQLRHCAPLALTSRLQAVMDHQLGRATAILGHKYQSLFEGDEDSKATRQYGRLCEVMAVDVVPFLVQGFYAIYPTGPSHLQGTTVLDVNILIGPLKGIYVDHTLEQLLSATGLEENPTLSVGNTDNAPLVEEMAVESTSKDTADNAPIVEKMAVENTFKDTADNAPIVEKMAVENTFKDTADNTPIVEKMAVENASKDTADNAPIPEEIVVEKTSNNTDNAPIVNEIDVENTSNDTADNAPIVEEIDVENTFNDTADNAHIVEKIAVENTSKDTADNAPIVEEIDVENTFNDTSDNEPIIDEGVEPQDIVPDKSSENENENIAVEHTAG